MTQLLAHLVGDFLLQSQAMADRKVTDLRWACIHAVFYTLPFLFLTTDLWRLAVIGGTHAVIDRYRLAAKSTGWWGSWNRERGLWARWNVSTEPVPPFLVVWGTIVTDNTMHMLINYAALTAAT